MIPYDDLVTALTSWRARQGLPVAAGAPPPGSGPTAAPAPGSGPTAASLSGTGPRAVPPSAPPKSAAAYQPPPLETADDSLDVDDEALLEEAHYENEGDDFAMKFAGEVEADGESTTLGQAPAERDSFGGETELDPNSKKPW